MILPGNAQAIGRRAEQQDAHAFSDLADEATVARSGALCVVCDGMGGHAAGGEAARAAVAGFLASYRDRDTADTIPVSLARALDAANEAVLEVAVRAGDAGSTLVAAVVHEGLLHWIGLGDSRIWLLRAGRLHRVNHEHRHRGDLLRQAAHGRLGWAEALADPLGERLTASLGEAPLPRADASLHGFPMQAGDQVLLVTDGLYRSVDAASLLAAARAANDARAGAGADPQALCDRWADLALAADLPDQDNLTIASLAWPIDADAAEARPSAAPVESPGVPLPGEGAQDAPSRASPTPTLPPEAPVRSGPAPRWRRPALLAGVVGAVAVAAWVGQRLAAGDAAPEPQAVPTPARPAAADALGQAPDRPKRAAP